MKVLESAPERYERGMRILTLGRWERVQCDIVARLKPGDQVLDLGCGTGALAVRLARRGCQVTGVDSSPAMLDQAGRHAQQEGMAGQVTFRELGVVELDTAFEDASFDAVVSTLLFSELSEDEIDYALVECRRVLRPDGQLLVADEVLPDSALGRLGTFLLRLPFALLAFVLTQNTTRRVAGLRARIEKAGFRIVDVEFYLAGTLRLFVSEKAGEKCLTG
jgi:ubiquinone/menaquinone biosynthesis C-methylase UbiE